MLAALRVFFARILGFFRRRGADRELMEELEAHLEMATAEKIRQGLDPKEARRQARVELGGLTQLQLAARDARGLPGLDAFWLDVKLSLRMLVKSWGLTLVGGLAMTLAISVGVFVFWLLEMLFSPELPLDDGQRVVAVQTWDDRAGARHETSWRDFERWRSRLRSFEDFGAYREQRRYLVTPGGISTPISIAQISAAGFRLTRIPPQMGRPLLEADERPEAPPVVVIGHDLWQSKFAADPRVVGETVQLGGAAHTVVGVMPEGFEFPLNHQIWTPLRVDPAEASTGFLPDEGEASVIFGRLAPGSTQAGAEAELLAMGLVSPAAGDETKALRPRVVPYAFAFTGDFEPGETPWVVRIILVLISLVLIPPCANIAILVYARTIARQEELASRFVLGASRGRIVAQLFIEVLVLALVAAAASLVVVGVAGAALENHVESGTGGAPFWFDFSLSWRTVLFAMALALFAAAVTSLVPALKVTGRRMHSGLGGRSTLKLGRTWTALVVLQVALTLAALPSAVEMGWGTVRDGVLGPGFAADRFLTARLALDREMLLGDDEDDSGELVARFETLRGELLRRLEAEPEIEGAGFATSVPGEEPWAVVEVEGVELPDDRLLENRDVVQFNQVDAAFFGLLDAPILLGRSLESGDFAGAGRPLIVNQTFVDLLLVEQNPLGRRVRYSRKLGDDGPAEEEHFFDIVGVVADRPAHGGQGAIYHPLPHGSLASASLLLRSGVEPASLADRLREISRSLDPALRLHDVLALDAIYRQQQIGNNLGASTLVAVTLSVLLLSAAGIYALMSFTVNRRRREIGIRAALGAQPRRLLFAVFRRSLLQVGAGALAGSLVAFAIDRYLPIEQVGGADIPGILPGAVLFMLCVAASAAAGPAARGLRVDPIEELREG